MDSKISKKTQDTLGKIIKKPPLTEKLLNKPPFRFLHDIFTEVIRTTDFMKGLFSAEEMDSKNVTSKEAKLVFLQKAIDCVAAVSGESLSVRPNKVIAGHEPENTNALLQAIASCINKKLSSNEAVEIVLSGKTGRKASKSSKTNLDKKQTEPSPDQKETESRKRSKQDASGEKSREKSSESRRRSSAKVKESSGRLKKEEESSGKSRKGESSSKSRSKDKDREASTTEPDTGKKRPEKKPSHDPIEELQNGEHAEEAPTEPEQDEGSAPPANRGPRPASAKGQRRKPKSNAENREENFENDAIAKRHDAAPSVRPGAPKIKQRMELAEDHIDSGAVQQTANIIVDKDSDGALSDDEDAQFLVKEAVPTHDAVAEQHLDEAGSDDESDEEHGGLVKKILETKKELEESAAAAADAEVKAHTEIERSTLTAQQKKEREMVAREIEELRNSVQKLCQSVAPLAKIIDYIQEDMDAMQNELTFWKEENKQHAVQLKDEEVNTQKSIEPLHHELKELQLAISSYRNQMAATKANVIRNDEKIRKMVTAVAIRS